MMHRVWRTSGSNVVKRMFAKVKSTRISVDRTGLAKIVDDERLPESIVVKEPMTALGKDLQSYIKLKGPITLHDYMAQTLNHMIHGYYQSKNEVIGEGGDFITAPEVSQLFGEMLGIWCISMWEQMGRPAKLNLVELGPGKGTLMKDMLSVAAKFAPFKEAISVHLVELSLSLRVKQYETLGCSGGVDASVNNSGSGSGGVSIKDKTGYLSDSGVSVHWNSFLYQVPEDVPSLIIGQEFLDAFPVHQFSYTDKGWREKLVDVNSSFSSVSTKPIVTTGNPKIAAVKAKVLANTAASPAADAEHAPVEEPVPAVCAEADAYDAAKYHFRLVLSTNATPAVRFLLLGNNQNQTNSEHGSSGRSSSSSSRSGFQQQQGGGGGGPRPFGFNSTVGDSGGFGGNNAFQQGRVGGTTADAETKATDTASLLNPAGASAKVGDGVEISPLAIATCEDIARRVVRTGGAALLVDYGEDFTQEDSLRAFQKHKQVSVLSQPGTVDVTADVDFSVCRRAAVRQGARVLPLLTQGQFLMRMGVVSRVEQLMEAEGTTDEQASSLVAALKYLVEPQQMGEKFKVLSIVNPALTSVVGFDN